MKMYLIVLLLLSGCIGGTPKVLPEKLVYKRDLAIEVNGLFNEGTIVVPEAKKYEFLVESRGSLDMFVLTSCNREWVQEKAWNVTIKQKKRFGWTRKIVDTKKVKFTYIPNDLEKLGTCPLRLEGYETKTGKRSKGFIDFRKLSETLPATVYCNGDMESTVGTGVCENRIGLIQGIKFNEEVVTAPDEECAFGQERGKYFEIPIKQEECIYIFRTINKPHRDYRFTTLGYDEILIREGL